MADTNKFFPQIAEFVLSTPLLEATANILQAEGLFKKESILFWAGSVNSGIATVTDILVPKGPGVVQRPLHIRVDDRVVARLLDVIDPPRLVLLGQIHTHLADAFHSYTDDHFSFGTPGFISAVVPNGARGGAEQWRTWSFFECMGGVNFKPLEQEELDRRFHIGSHDVQIHEIHSR